MTPSMRQVDRRISGSRRVTAIVSLVTLAAVTVIVGIFLIRNVAHLLVGLVGLFLAAAGGWEMLTERGLRRHLGAGAVGFGLGVVIIALAAAWDGQQGIAVRFALVVLLLAVSLASGRYALRRGIPEPAVLMGRSVQPARPVLLANPWSGGGKVGQLELPRRARELGVETVMLDREHDLAQLAREAVDAGADCLGMAGGDGSLGVVAAVAIDHDLPFVVVPTGTRNHLAVDLSFDRDDPIAALRAFVEGHERRIDYATVNDRVFVNNVSLGVYATIVRESSYRDDKLGTAAHLLPDLLGTQTEPFDLQFVDPDGGQVDSAYLVQVSNNPYALDRPLDFGQRLHLDSGVLGVVAVGGERGIDSALLMTHLATNTLARSGNYLEWTTSEFEVMSRSGTALAGVDGEPQELTTPLTFRVHPLGLRLLVATDNLIAAETRRSRDVRIGKLIDTALGKPGPDQAD